MSVEIPPRTPLRGPPVKKPRLETPVPSTPEEAPRDSDDYEPPPSDEDAADDEDEDGDDDELEEEPEEEVEEEPEDDEVEEVESPARTRAQNKRKATGLPPASTVDPKRRKASAAKTKKAGKAAAEPLVEWPRAMCDHCCTKQDQEYPLVCSRGEDHRCDPCIDPWRTRCLYFGHDREGIVKVGNTQAAIFNGRGHNISVRLDDELRRKTEGYLRALEQVIAEEQAPDPIILDRSAWDKRCQGRFPRDWETPTVYQYPASEVDIPRNILRLLCGADKKKKKPNQLMYV